MSNREVIIDGIQCFAPELTQQSEGYPFEIFARIDELERNHFWYSGRRSIAALIKRNCSINIGDHFLEIGGGTGANANFLRERLRVNVLVSEISIEAIKNAKKRYPDNTYVQMDARKIPFKESFDIVGIFDVIEHINEDEQVMAQIYRATRPKGLLVISVPQYQWLWSSHDDLSGHKRRYTRKTLTNLISTNGFEIISMTSFLFTAFPLILIARRFKTDKTVVANAHLSEVSGLELPAILNRCLLISTWIDCVLIRVGISLRFGGSLLAVCRKNS